MKISIIIVNYNVRYFLQQCLQSVKKSIVGIDAEIFVVDNVSEDGSVEMVRELFPEVNLIANTENLGFSKANNQAIKLAKGEFILLLNPDTVIEEETIAKVCSFMDHHADAGGLGVHMIDGKGIFLPESKRGLPTPLVAFYKIFGFANLFPKSKTFGRYHLGFLDKDKTHEVEVLSGAFMLLRKKTLDKIGLLDEDYFMYGEDIDLSYRILQGGYKNYYFPETHIIHYKGESTKKSSVNYVLVFYRAMVIFAKKHFAPRRAALFSFLINIAIWMRAGIALLQQFIERIWLPLVDAVIIYTGIIFIKNYWEYTVKDVHYPAFFMQIILPCYILIWLISAFLGGGYDQPIRISRMIRGLLTGSVVILVVYALLPENYRFSRALILLGTAWASLSIALLRLFFHFIKLKGFQLADAMRKRMIIVGDAAESQRILSLLMMSGTSSNFVGFVTESGSKENQELNMQNFYLGNTIELPELISMYEINEVIFCGKNISSSAIIQQMLKMGNPHVEFKIAPPESLFIIGSNSINDKGDFYLIDVPTYNNPVNRRNKKLFDLTTCFILFFLSPILILFSNKSSNYFSNIFKVLIGNLSWVGYKDSQNKKLKGIRDGVFSPTEMLAETPSDQIVIDRLNALYSKEYKVFNDLRIVRKGLFGRK